MFSYVLVSSLYMHELVFFPKASEKRKAPMDCLEAQCKVTGNFK